MVGNLRLVLSVDVAPGNQHTSKHRTWNTKMYATMQPLRPS
jgi:hypothetical protein